MTEPNSGATRTAAAPRRPWWIWALIALVVIVLLVLFLVQCGSGSGGDDPDPAAAPAATSAPAAAPSAGADAGGSASAPTTAAGGSGAAGASTAPGAGGGGAAAGAGALTAGDTALLPLAGAAGPSGELTALVGRPVAAQGVAVESVPSDEGFWIGTSPTDRVFVQLTVPPGESPFQVQPGQLVAFTGTLAANAPGYTEQAGVTAEEGADLLNREAAHIDVDKANLQLR
jgi:hypothetical protein